MHRIGALRCPAAETVLCAAPGQPCARCRTLATICDRRLLAWRRARARAQMQRGKQQTRSTWRTCPSILSSTRASSPHAVVRLAGNRTSHTCWMDCPRSFPWCAAALLSHAWAFSSGGLFPAWLCAVSCIACSFHLVSSVSSSISTASSFSFSTAEYGVCVISSVQHAGHGGGVRGVSVNSDRRRHGSRNGGRRCYGTS